MRNNNHHTIFQLGFSYILNKLESIYSTQSDYFKYEGNITYNNRPCYKITLEIPDYKYIKYTIKPNETIAAIAKKLNIGEYKILELNTDIEDVYYTKPNRVITIPNYYAKKMELYIDQGNYLPIFQKISDDKGLYEQYEYLNVIVNPKYSSTDFEIKEND
jgi:LysM repeat protein